MNIESAVRFYGQRFLYTVLNKRGSPPEKEDITMKGYYNNSGYMGYVDGRWVLFASEGDYQEYVEA